MHKQETNRIKKLDELVIANKELAFQNEEKEKRVAELIIANSDLEKAEEKIIKTNRLFYVISQINQLIVRTTDEQTLFEETCNITIDLGKFRMAWIGIADEKTKKIIPVAHSGEEYGYLSKIKTISVDNVTEGRGPAGKAFREGKYSVCNDIENNPNMTPWKTEALKHGYYSSIGLPIKKFGKVVGVFNLYAAEPNFFDDSEIALLDEISGDISFALENFEKEEQRKKVEVALRESEETFRRLFNESADSILLLDDTGFTDCNQSAVSILGYSSKQEVINKKPWDISPEKQPDGRLSTEKATEMMAKALQQGYNRFEWVHTKSDGTEFPVEVMLTPITLRGKQSFYTIWRDITERKKAEVQLNKSESKFRQLMEASTDALIGANKEGKIVYANKEATILFGYNTNELLNNKIEMLLPGRFRRRHEGYRAGYEANPVTRAMGKASLPLYGRRKDGSEFATDISLKSIETEEGLVVMNVIRDITEKKKVEENLKQSENRFRELFESAPEGLVVVDNTTFTFVKFNANAAKLFKYSAEEFIKKGPLDTSPLFQPDGRSSEEKAKELMINLMKGDNPVFEWLIIDANGKEIICEVRLTLLSNINGSQHLASFIDITERKQAEEALKLFRMLIDRSNDAIEIIDMETGGFLDVNEKGCLELGYSREEFLALSVFDIDPRVDQSNFRSIGEELRKSGSLLWEGYHRRKDGSTFPVEVNIKYVQLDRDYMITVVRDITERKQAEEKLKESERFLNESQAVSKIGSYVLDFNTGEWKSSHELNNIFGLTANGKHTFGEWLSLIHPDHQKMMQEYFTQEVIGKKQRFDKEYKIKNKNTGEECWVHGIGDLEIDSTGVPVKMLGTIQDITERKKSELLLKHLNDNLEKKAAELEISNTELEQFAYIASHDLQEPLRMVSSFMNLLEKRMGGQLDDTNKKYIHFAADGAMRMKILIQDLLLYSKVGSNQENFTATNLNEVMQYVNQLLEENIKEIAATITVKPLPVIRANKTLISQLLVNLLSNSLKYHRDNDPEIEVGYNEDPGNWIFYVKDNGIGIDPKFFDKIFIIFQRLHNKSEYSGTGIGLAICKKIIEIHKGKIWVESEPGKGSTFYFSIPKIKQSA